MAPTKFTVTLAACAVLASSNAFMPQMSAKQSSSVKPAAKASAAALLAAGAILQGAAVAPVQAADFDIGQPTQLVSGIFGSKDATPAAKPDTPKYDIQNKGSFAKKNSEGGVDYGSPKGTDFGDLAGKAAGVADEKKGTNFNNDSSGSKQAKAADVVSQVAEKGEGLASSFGSSLNLSQEMKNDKAGIGAAVELGKQSPSLGGGSNWGNKDVVAEATGTAKDITTKPGGLKDALKQGAQTWSGIGNPISAPAEVATKPFGEVKQEQSNMQESTGRESRKETLSRATSAIKSNIDAVNNGGGDQYKGINPEQ